MAKISIFNIGKANAEIDAACAALAPALAKAGISTIAVDGKTVPAADAPLSAQISALLAAQPVVADSQNAAEALASNELISSELTKTKTDLALKITAVESLTRDKTDLTEKLSTANATVQDLTTKNNVLTTERDACSSQFGQASKDLTAQKTELASLAIAAGCLDLKDGAGKPFAADGAGAALKLSAAMKLSHGDLLKAYRGAVNAAIAQTGGNPIEAISAPPAGHAAKPELKGRARFIAAESAKAAAAKP